MATFIQFLSSPVWVHWQCDLERQVSTILGCSKWVHLKCTFLSVVHFLSSSQSCNCPSCCISASPGSLQSTNTMPSSPVPSSVLSQLFTTTNPTTALPIYLFPLMLTILLPILFRVTNPSCLFPTLLHNRLFFHVSCFHFLP